MSLDKEELAKLSPQERVARLKKIEKEREQEIEEAKKLLKSTQEEILRTPRRQMEVPTLDPVDISKMFEAGDGIEATVKDAPKLAADHVEYTTKIDYQEAPKAGYETEARADDRHSQLTYHSQSEELANLIAGNMAVKSLNIYRKG